MEPATAADGRRFGKYTLVAKLATGGMAEIFLARLHGDGGFEKLVCIKRILPHLARDPQFVAMFLDEARVAARISHPNVCQVFELGEWQRQYYIAMEYLEGVPLAVFRRKDFYAAPPDPRLVAGFGVQACEGLHHAHQLKRPDGELLGVVHRDITPQNVFATTDGVVKVLDFGIAKVQDASVRTSTGAIKGTYAYMAPEQLRNEHLDRRADVWSMGVVLWETLAQTHLFKRDTEFLTFEAITKLPIQHISEVRPDVPPLLGDTIARALSRNPDDRFPSARALGEALAQAVGPLGGPLTQAGISDEVAQSFEAALAEQRMLLRIAREGGQFDLESSSPLVGHGARMSTTPVSNIQRRAEEAAQEVANFVAAKHAIESLEDELASDGRPQRFGTDGAFTPAPSRGPRSQLYAVPEAEYDEGFDPDAVDEAPPPRRASRPMPAQRRSSPYPIAPSDWRHDETEPPLPGPRVAMPHAPTQPSRLPWIIALVSVAIAGATGTMLYVKLAAPANRAPAAAPTSAPPTVAMSATPTAAPAAPTPAPQTSAGSAPEPTSTDGAPTEPTASTEPAEPIEPAAPTVDVKVTATAEAVEPTVVEQTPPPKQPKITKVEPAKVAPAKVEPARVEPTKVAPAKVEPAKVAPAKVAPAKVEPAKVEQAAPKATTAGPRGMITIDSAPVYAVIYIDGKKMGETPLVNIKLSPGTHAVRAVSPSGATKTLSITIEAGKTAPPRKISW